MYLFSCCIFKMVWNMFIASSCPRFILYGMLVLLWRCGLIKDMNSGMVLLRMCVMQRESVVDSLSVWRSCILRLNWTIGILPIQTVLRFRADPLSKFVLNKIVSQVWYTLFSHKELFTKLFSICGKDSCGRRAC